MRKPGAGTNDQRQLDFLPRDSRRLSKPTSAGRGVGSQAGYREAAARFLVLPFGSLVCLCCPYGVRPRGLCTLSTVMIFGLVAEAAAAGAVRQDVPAEELASYCVHALAAAGDSSTTALDRLLDLVWTGITSTRSTQSHVRHGASQPD